MIYRFLILSDEVDDFRREIKISPEATFLDLHNAILDATRYKRDEMSSFFICDDDWNKKTEITLVDMGAPSETDTFLMENTPLDELLEDERQKLLYVFDYFTERAFFIELSEIITGQTIDHPVCSLSAGQPPAQTISIEEMEKNREQFDLNEDFYGDADFNDDELDDLDAEDFSSGSDSFYDDERF